MLPHASQLILVAWIAIGLSLIGLGLLFRRLCSAAARGAEGLLLSFWLGWAVLLVGLQVWHFFLPVDTRARVVTSVLALIGLVVGGWRPWWSLVRGGARRWLSLIAFAVSALWLANRALGGPHFGDVGLYHLPLVQWALEYPIIPGLGNLYVPFGRNFSYFLYVAWLNVGPFAHRTYHLANSILVLALLARGFLGFDRLVHLKRACAPHDVFYALFVPALVLQALEIFFTSPSPDQPIFLFGIVLSGELLAFFARPATSRSLAVDVVALTLLASAAISVKMTIAGLAGAVLLLTIVRWMWLERPFGRSGVATLGMATAIGTFAVAVWVIGNIILTGCPLHPSEFAALPVEWRMRADAIKFIEGPMQFGAPLWRVIWDWRWFGRRLDSLGWADPEVVLPVAIAVVVTVATALGRLVVRRRGARRVPMVILLPAIVSFAFCFTYTPMPRYAGATMWILAVEGVVLAMGTAAYGSGRARRLLVAGLVVVGVVGAFLWRRPVLLNLRGFEPKPGARLVPQLLESGLVVQVPQVAQACWDGLLPCTPDPDPRLRLRRPGDLASGFMIDPSPPWRDGKR